MTDEHADQPRRTGELLSALVAAALPGSGALAVGRAELVELRRARAAIPAT